jgi:hypothetical protein
MKPRLASAARASRVAEAAHGHCTGFALTINQLKGKVSMLFITHALPKGLVVDGV